MDATRTEPAITPELVRAAVGMLNCRFGALEAEADRRGRTRALLRSSRALALALEHFARKAAPHSRGEHASADLRAEADAMAQALADWSFAVCASADTHARYRAEERSCAEHGAIAWPPRERGCPPPEA